MSKTYRRTWNGRKIDWLPSISENDINGGNKWGCCWPPDPKAIEWIKNNPHRSRDIGNHFYSMWTIPSWWNREFHTKPCRAKERNLLHKIKQGVIDADDIVWPTNKKPYKDFW